MSYYGFTRIYLIFGQMRERERESEGVRLEMLVFNPIWDCSVIDYHWRLWESIQMKRVCERVRQTEKITQNNRKWYFPTSAVCFIPKKLIVGYVTIQCFIPLNQLIFYSIFSYHRCEHISTGICWADREYFSGCWPRCNVHVSCTLFRRISCKYTYMYRYVMSNL